MSRKSKSRSLEIRLQRAYDEPDERDGYRVLVDRYWPRGRTKASLKLDESANGRQHVVQRNVRQPCVFASADHVPCPGTLHAIALRGN